MRYLYPTKCTNCNLPMSSLNRFKNPSTEPFLSLQKNSIIRNLSTAYGRETEVKPHLYKKPSAICQLTAENLPSLWKDSVQFAKDWMTQIQFRVEAIGLKVKEMEDADTPAIREFLLQRYNERMANEICAFDLFRFRNFGHGMLLMDEAGNVQGTIFEVAYDTEEKTSYTIRLAIAEEWKGKNLGTHLMRYSSLKALTQGSGVKRGIIQVDNLASLHINLNKVGWICDKYEAQINGLGSFFHIALPLDLQGLTGNIIDFERCKSFVEEQVEGLHYRLIDCDKQEEIAEMYQNSTFKICALMKSGILSPKAQFLAIPAEELGMS